MKDIAPELLEKLQKEFKKKFESSNKLKKLNKILLDKKATHKDSNDFAIAVGELLSKVFQENLSASDLPDGKMYYNIADRILNPTLRENHNIVSNFAKEVQTDLNHRAGLRIKGKAAKLNQDRIDGIINRISYEDDFDKAKWLLDEPVINFSQSIVDDTIKENAKFHHKLGLAPKIIRKESGNCCDWCNAVVGIYKYPDVPKDIYKRHRYCRCTVEYDPGDGKRQNVHSKKWVDPDRQEKIEQRKKVNSKPKRKSYAETTYGTAHGRQIDKKVDSSNELTKNVYRKYENKLETSDPQYKGSRAFYSPATQKVTLNIEATSKGSSISTPYQTYFHENGHMIDYLANRHNNKFQAASEIFVGSSGETLGQTAKKELKNKLNQIKKEKRYRYKSQAVDDYISGFVGNKELVELGDFSDILEGAGIGKAYPLGTGHGKDYWKNRDNGKEIFAELFSAEMANERSLSMIKNELPETYMVYRELLKYMEGII